MSFKLTVLLSLPILTSVLIPAPTAPLITRAAKLTFTFWESGFMCLTVTLDNRRYTLNLSTSHGFNMSSHLAVPVSRLSFTVISHSIFTTSCFRTRLQVHSCQQKSIGLKFSKSQTGSDMRYSCHHNLSRFTFPISVHSCRFSVLHSLQSITPRIY